MSSLSVFRTYALIVTLLLAACANRTTDTRDDSKQGRQAQPPASNTAVVDIGEKGGASPPVTRQIIQGTGALIATPTQEQAQAAAGSDAFQLNFVDTDIA